MGLSDIAMPFWLITVRRAPVLLTMFCSSVPVRHDSDKGLSHQNRKYWIKWEMEQRYVNVPCPIHPEDVNQTQTVHTHTERAPINWNRQVHQCGCAEHLKWHFWSCHCLCLINTLLRTLCVRSEFDWHVSSGSFMLLLCWDKWTPRSYLIGSVMFNDFI